MYLLCPDAPWQLQKCGFFCWDFLLVEWWLFGLVSFFMTLGGAPRMDFSLSSLPSLTFSVLGSVSSKLSLLAGGTKMALLKALEEVLHEEREWSYPRLVLSNASFWKLSISSSLALEVLSNCTLTWNNYASIFLVFLARKLFSNRSSLMIWLASSTLVESSSHSNSTSLSFLVANL